MPKGIRKDQKMNSCVLSGNLTRDTETKTFDGGNTVAHVGLAVNRKYRVDDKLVEEVTFVNLEAWGRQAEVLGEYGKKGKKILFDCRYKVDNWEKDGEKRSSPVFVVNNFEFMSGPTKDEDVAPEVTKETPF